MNDNKYDNFNINQLMIDCINNETGFSKNKYSEMAARYACEMVKEENGTNIYNQFFKKEKELHMALNKLLFCNACFCFESVLHSSMSLFDNKIKKVGKGK